MSEEKHGSKIDLTKVNMNPIFKTSKTKRNWDFFRKKPVIIQAFQWFESLEEDRLIEPFNYPDGNERCNECKNPYRMHGYVDTKEGGHRVCPGDWIIKGVKGEYYPCKPDIFEMTYEHVE